MAYAQTNYSETMGNGKYTISEIGCFLTAFSNLLLLRFNITETPPTLNTFFQQHGDYLSDPEDGSGVKDDLAWTSITAFNPLIVVSGEGTSGWPNSNNAIVKFAYEENGSTMTHFCLVAEHTAQTIVDSWDGVTKTVGKYGQPVAWAEYTMSGPSTTNSAAQAVHVAANANDTLKSLFLPSAAGTWRIYNVGGPWTTPHAIHMLQPGKFPPGLSYSIISTIAPNIYKIKTQDFGVVAIYAGPDTIAKITVGGNGAGISSPEPKTYTEATVDSVTFQTLPNSPKQMWVSNPNGAHKWNFQGVSNWRGFKAVTTLAYGTELFLSGVAHHSVPPNGADFYMTNDDFGDFKKTGKVTNWYGFNWDDISDKRPTPKPITNLKPLTTIQPNDVPKPVTVQAESTANNLASNWQDSYVAFAKPVKYFSIKDIQVKDYSANPLPDLALPKYNQDSDSKAGLVNAYGTFNNPDGEPCYRLKPNTDTDFSTWYGVPKIDANGAPNLLVFPVTVVKPPSVIQPTPYGGSAMDEPKFIDILPSWFKNKLK